MRWALAKNVGWWCGALIMAGCSKAAPPDVTSVTVAPTPIIITRAAAPPVPPRVAPAAPAPLIPMSTPRATATDATTTAEANRTVATPTPTRATARTATPATIDASAAAALAWRVQELLPRQSEYSLAKKLETLTKDEAAYVKELAQTLAGATQHMEKVPAPDETDTAAAKRNLRTAQDAARDNSRTVRALRLLSAPRRFNRAQRAYGEWQDDVQEGIEKTVGYYQGIADGRAPDARASAAAKAALERATRSAQGAGDALNRALDDD